MLNQIILKIGGFVFLIIISFVMGWKVCSWKIESSYKSQYMKLIDQINIEQAKNQKLSDQYESELRSYQTQIKKVNQDVQVEIKKPVYVNCVVPASGVQLINNAVSAANQVKSSK